MRVSGSAAIFFTRCYRVAVLLEEMATSGLRFNPRSLVTCIDKTLRGCTHSHRQVMVSLYLSFHPFLAHELFASLFE